MCQVFLYSNTVMTFVTAVFFYCAYSLSVKLKEE
jgi:hypothetical protein